MSECPVTKGEVDLAWYAARDSEFRALGLSRPACRALIDHGILKPTDLRKFKLEEVLSWHGIGKSAIPILSPLTKK